MSARGKPCVNLGGGGAEVLPYPPSLQTKACKLGSPSPARGRKCCDVNKEIRIIIRIKIRN
jgi:hypothetical protein